MADFVRLVTFVEMLEAGAGAHQEEETETVIEAVKGI